ncbi:hypothetical protein [Alteribacter populi]|uniref:hypothetical protein n=1 Tax=Alteribacter populi TaxID=2011011 RepID=UPI000BBB45F6|nr:hypothetical protein [Alteribacter populi]
MKNVLFLFAVSILLLVACGEQAEGNASDSENEELQSEEKSEQTDDTKTTVDESTNNDDSDTEKEENEIYSDDVKEFIESFNLLASLEDDIDLIEAVEPAEEDDDGYTQLLYSSSEYGLSALYKKDGEVESYVFVISDDQPYRDLKGNALFAMLHVGAALDLDIEELTGEFEGAIPNHAGMYLGDDYTVTFSSHDSPDIGMVVMFINLSFSEGEEDE